MLPLREGAPVGLDMAGVMRRLKSMDLVNYIFYRKVVMSFD
jgi:hypothetical protein